MMDKDGSGVIEAGELSALFDGAAREQMLGVLDSNGDGEVCEAEWVAYLSLKRQEKGHEGFEKFLAMIRRRLGTRLAAAAAKDAAASGGSEAEVTQAALEAAKEAGASTDEAAHVAGVATGRAVVARGGSVDEARRAGAEAAKEAGGSVEVQAAVAGACLLYTSPSPRDS